MIGGRRALLLRQLGGEQFKQASSCLLARLGLFGGRCVGGRRSGWRLSRGLGSAASVSAGSTGAGRRLSWHVRCVLVLACDAAALGNRGADRRHGRMR
jgi:hypothetical protein